MNRSAITRALLAPAVLVAALAVQPAAAQVNYTGTYYVPV